MIILKSFRLLIIIISLTVLQSCNKNDSPLRVGTNVWPGYEPIYLAKELNYFPPKDIKAVQYTSASEVIRAFKHGAIDLATVTLDEAIVLASQGVAFEIIMITDISLGGDGLVSHKAFTKIADLKGKRVGVELKSVSHFLLYRALEQHDMSMNDVKLVNSRANEHESMFLSKKIDAVATFEPTLSTLEPQSNLLFTSQEIPFEIIDIIIARPNFSEQEKLKLKKFKQGWYKTIAYITKEPKASSIFMAKRLKTESQHVEKMLSKLEYPSEQKFNEIFYGSKQSEMLDAIETITRYLRSEKIINKDLHSILNNISPLQHSNKKYQQ